MSRKTETLAINFPSISDADFKVVTRRGAVVARFPFKKGSLSSQAMALRNAELLIHSTQMLKERAALLDLVKRLYREDIITDWDYHREAERLIREADKD